MNLYFIREQAFKQAAQDVCSFCGGRTLPHEPDAHMVHGPNSAGNYTHKALGETQSCKATAIWSRIRSEAQR